jgi:hypothetical protein
MLFGQINARVEIYRWAEAVIITGLLTAMCVSRRSGFRNSSPCCGSRLNLALGAEVIFSQTCIFSI